ncbi:hypothetical protein I6F35_31970 [Bradyrhizobium sp. BRP22]|uniref:hypothetical protein n=1 Tax=Bradyrhizobium sp. BRP22 TaxID=2793821 RepID=UPI001CD3D207|nr:hypothetical protein [Bradyrhizobium sp. BRP22]MCA1457749.1 hypothetical protein [Bradyrhizobium sp. BRP22]
MSRIISAAPTQNKPPKIALFAPYIDSIEVSTPHWLRPELMSCVRANCGSMKPDEVYDRLDPKRVRRHLLKINQPSRLCIELLQRYKLHDPKLSVYRVHPAFDVITIYDALAREDVAEVLTKLVHLRYRRGKDELHYEEGSLYSIRTRGRKSRPYRNTIFYDGKHSKITGELDAIHLEIRLERKRSVQAAGIEEPADLLKIKPIEIVAKQIVVKDIRNMLKKITLRGIKLTCADYPDVDRKHIERRIRAIYGRIGLDHASIFARRYPKQFERLKHWDCMDVEEGWNWASPDLQCDDKVGELRCLLPPTSFKPKVQRERL